MKAASSRWEHQSDKQLSGFFTFMIRTIATTSKATPKDRDFLTHVLTQRAQVSHELLRRRRAEAMRKIRGTR